MHRQILLDMLDRYIARHPDDRVRGDHVRQFARANADCFERSNREGHITASAWIVSSDHQRFLLTHHRKLDRWLQLGGHADGEPDPLTVALTEAREESGMQRFAILTDDPPVPLDVDVHAIPAFGDDPAHLHHDVRFLLEAAPDQEIVVSSESRDVCWFEWDRAAALLREPSLRRMALRAAERLNLSVPGLRA